MAFVRGSNPLWSFVDLVGKQFDDTFYMYVLQNELPYLPATVYHTSSGTPWTNPIQFFANGTLPIDIFWDDSIVYRLEFRKNNGVLPPSQNDPLIYLVENYIPGTGGDGPIDNVGLFTDNQMTNAQFSLISFQSPLTLTSITDPSPIEVAPGWFLELAGTGNVTLERIALNSSTPNPTNAPYALRIALSGDWAANPILRQRFQQNGMLWANKYVSSSITARIQGSPQEISARLVDSNGTTVATVLPSTIVNSAFNEYTGFDLVADTTNPDVPPAAWVDYQLLLPTDVNIFVTSLQVIASNLGIEFPYEEDTIDRQIDHTWHYYKDPVLFKPIPSLLTAWDFPLNPAQIHGSTVTMPTAASTPTANACYIWDQTISNSLVGSVAVVRNAVTGGFQATTANANEAFYMIQYLSGSQAKKMLGTTLSVNVQAFRTQAGGAVTAKVYLYSGRAAATFPALPVMIGTVAANGDFSLTAANWTEIPRESEIPASGLLSIVNTAAYETLNDAQDLQFNGWQITDAAQIADTDKFAIVVTFSCPTTASVVVVDSIGLVPGDVPTRPAPQDKEQVVAECQYYYEKTYPLANPAGTSTNIGIYIVDIQPAISGVTYQAYSRILPIRYETRKRVTPIFNTYSSAGLLNQISIEVYQAATLVTVGVPPVLGNWALADNGETGATLVPVDRTVGLATGVIGSPALPGAEALAIFHWTADARLGII